ncbi:MAG: lysoplasmalogenase [Armatimonadota bacterium]
MLHRRLTDTFHALAIVAVFSEQLPWPIGTDGIAYKVAKLGAMVFLMLTLVTHKRFAEQPRNLRWLVLSAWAASIAGDAFLAWSGFFIQGLASFLTAHILYCILFVKSGPRALHVAAAVPLVIFGASMATWLIASGGVAGGLVPPVMFYLIVILTMAMIAAARYKAQPTLENRTVLFGALFFVASDSLLAINKFIQPLPYSGVLVLGTYYSAQECLLMGWVRGLNGKASVDESENA